MKTYVFIDIDTQIDFIHDLGNLAVPGAEALRDNLKALTDFALANKIKIIASTDAHSPDDSEFEIFPKMLDIFQILINYVYGVHRDNHLI